MLGSSYLFVPCRLFIRFYMSPISVLVAGVEEALCSFKADIMVFLVEKSINGLWAKANQLGVILTTADPDPLYEPILDPTFISHTSDTSTEGNKILPKD